MVEGQRLGTGMDAEADRVKVAALKALLTSAAGDEERPLRLDGKEARLRELVARGCDANTIAVELDLPIDAIIAALWRLAG